MLCLKDGPDAAEVFLEVLVQQRPVAETGLAQHLERHRIAVHLYKEIAHAVEAAEAVAKRHLFYENALFPEHVVLGGIGQLDIAVVVHGSNFLVAVNLLNT